MQKRYEGTGANLEEDNWGDCGCWSSCPVRRGFRNTTCSAWTTMGSEGTEQLPLSTHGRVIERVERGSSWWEDDTAGCPVKLRRLCPWRCSRANWIKPWAAWTDLTADLSLGRALGWRPPEVSSKWNDPVILCYSTTMLSSASHTVEEFRWAVFQLHLKDWGIGPGDDQSW